MNTFFTGEHSSTMINLDAVSYAEKIDEEGDLTPGPGNVRVYFKNGPPSLLLTHNTAMMFCRVWREHSERRT